MSLFKTSIPVNVQELIDALPKNSFVHVVDFNHAAREVEVLWENERLDTGLSVPVPFTREQLASRKLPKGVRDASKPRPPVKQPSTEQNAPQANPEPTTPPPVYLTAEQYEEAVLKDVPMEFHGIEDGWKQVDPTQHEFTEGFFYRLKEPLDKKPPEV